MSELSEIDGRRQRGERSKRAIVDAALALIEDGVLVPTAQQVSDGAGVAMRTFFRHFNDMDSLFAAIDEATRGRMASLFNTEVPEGSLSDRIEAVVRDRGRAYEGVKNLALSTQALLWRSSYLRQQYAANQRLLRRDLEKRLPEIASLDTEPRESAHAIASIEMWGRLRNHQGLTPTASVALVSGMLKRLIS